MKNGVKRRPGEIPLRHLVYSLSSKVYVYNSILQFIAFYLCISVLCASHGMYYMRAGNSNCYMSLFTGQKTTTRTPILNLNYFNERKTGKSVHWLFERKKRTGESAVLQVIFRKIMWLALERSMTALPNSLLVYVNSKSAHTHTHK